MTKPLGALPLWLSLKRTDPSRPFDLLQRLAGWEATATAAELTPERERLPGDTAFIEHCHAEAERILGEAETAGKDGGLRAQLAKTRREGRQSTFRDWLKRSASRALDYAQ